MIKLHRLNGEEFVINADLIETLQSGKETIVFLTSGNQVVVKESSDEIISRTVLYKKQIAQDASKKNPLISS